MASDFLIALRKVRFEKEQFPEGPQILFDEYCKLQGYLSRNVEKRPRTTKEYALNTFNEIRAEEKRLRKSLETALTSAFKYQQEKRPGNLLNGEELKDLTYWSEEVDYFAEILNCCGDAKSEILEFFAAYMPKEMAISPIWRKEVRELLPVYNIYREKVEMYVNKYVKGGMFSIDNQIARVKNTSDREIKVRGQVLKPGHSLELLIEPRNEFDLTNKDLFDCNYRIIEDAQNPKDYDLAFSNRLASITPIYNSTDFLEYHYNKTPDKSLFLNHIQYHILLNWGNKPSVRTDFVQEWIKIKRRETSISTKPSLPKDLKLSVRQICLIRFYNDSPIEKAQRNEVAKAYGYTGDSLYNTFIKLFNDVNERQKGTRQNINDLTRILPELTGQAKARAITDLNVAAKNSKA